MAKNTTNCGCETSDTQGCAPLPVVERGTRVIAVGTDGCPVAVSGAGVLVQSPAGVYMADGSTTKPIELGAVATSPALNGILGTFTSGNSQFVKALSGSQGDVGKVVKWDGMQFVLKSLLESLCYPTEVVATTCCPELGLAVWSSLGTSTCLQRWDPCTDVTNKAVSNPKFVACEDGGMVAFTLCDLPPLVAGTSYQAIVCTEDGPRVLAPSGTNVNSLQYVPFDTLGSGNPIIYPETNTYTQANGTNVNDTINFATATGIAIPSGATHVDISFNIVMSFPRDGRTLYGHLYVPGSVAPANLRAYLQASGGGDAGVGTSALSGTVNVSMTAPLNNGTLSWLLVKSGNSDRWISSVMVRIEGYWVG